MVSAMKADPLDEKIRSFETPTCPSAPSLRPANLTHRLGQRKDDLPVALDQGIHPSSASNIEIHVDTSKVVKEEVSDRIRSLNVVFVGIVHLEERGVVFLHEGMSRFIRPEHIFADHQYQFKAALRLHSLIGHSFSTFFPCFAPFLW